MRDAGTELENADALASEVQNAIAAAEGIAEAMDGLKGWGSALPDRWTGSGWGTERLDKALTDVSAALSGLKTPDQMLEQLRAIAAELDKARAFGEAADQAKASGDLAGFTTARRARPMTEPETSSAPAPATAGDLAARIRASYVQLSRQPGESWISLVSLRAALPDVPRNELDAELENLALTPGVHVVAEDNQQTLTAADREAAVTFGGSARHMLRIESERAPRRHRRPTT